MHEITTGEELKQAAIAKFGPRGWQKRTAVALGKDVSSIRRYVSDGSKPLPRTVALAASAILNTTPNGEHSS